MNYTQRTMFVFVIELTLMNNELSELQQFFEKIDFDSIVMMLRIKI